MGHFTGNHMCNHSRQAAAATFRQGAPALARLPPPPPDRLKKAMETIALTKVAKGMSPLDVLIVEDQIRQKWADYSLLLDGDGVSNESAEWANRMFTEDLKWRWYDADGKLRLALNSRAEEQKARRVGRTQVASKHLPMTIKFDEVTPTMVKTRAIVTLMRVPLSTAEGQPDGVPRAGVAGIPTATMVVYHDTWRKTEGEWKKAVTILYSANYGGQYRSTESCPLPANTAPGCAPVTETATASGQ
jgi:hypothetical protein